MLALLAFLAAFFVALLRLFDVDIELNWWYLFAAAGFVLMALPDPTVGWRARRGA